MNRLFLAAVLAATVWPAAAGERKADPTLVLTRTVQPRIAYHALPPEQNPAAASVSTFPARVFHATIDDATSAIGDQLLGETFGEREFDAADARAADGPGAASPLTFGAAGESAAARAPIGPGATVRAAVSGVTSGLADLIGGALGQTRGGGGR